MSGGIEIPLTRGMFAIVDEIDFEDVSQHRWYAQRGKRTFYAARDKTIDGKKFHILMPRAILKVSDSRILVDHRNGNGLDNRRSNLRTCTIAENNCNRQHLQRTNTSGVHGVFWDSGCNKWRASITANNKTVYIGIFNDKDAAKKARDAKALEFFGEFCPIGGTV